VNVWDVWELFAIWIYALVILAVASTAVGLSQVLECRLLAWLWSRYMRPFGRRKVNGDQG
jgi:hypothetical protein